MIALVAKVHRVWKDSATAWKASDQAESTLISSPQPITERLLAVASASAGFKTAQPEYGKVLRGLYQDIGILQRADRSLRVDLADHPEKSKKTIRLPEQTASTVKNLLLDIHRFIDNGPQTPPQAANPRRTCSWT